MQLGSRRGFWRNSKGDLIEHGTGYDLKNLIFKDGFNSIVKDALKQRDYADDFSLIGKVAKMIREDMLLHDGFVFDGKCDFIISWDIS